MERQINSREVTLDDLLALVDKATGAIEQLQKENARLQQQVRDYKAAYEALASELAARTERIAALEHSYPALQKDADWCRWFRAKYGDSTFFSHIEREYQLSQADARDEADARIGIQLPQASANPTVNAVHNA